MLSPPLKPPKWHPRIGDLGFALTLVVDVKKLALAAGLCSNFPLATGPRSNFPGLLTWELIPDS